MKKSVLLIPLVALLLSSCGTGQKYAVPAPVGHVPEVKQVPVEDPAVVNFKASMREATLDYYNGNFGGALGKYILLFKETKSEEVLANMAVVYKDTAYYSDAIRNYELALERKDDPFWRLNLGFCHYYIGENENAKKNLESVFFALDSLKKQDSDTYKMRTLAAFGLGLVFLEIKEADSAARMFKKVLEYDTHFAQAHFLLAEYYSASGELDSALSCYQNAVKYDSSFYKANLRMAELYVKKEKYAEAFENYKKVSFIEPGNKEVAAKVRELSSKAAEYIKTAEISKEKVRKETKSPKVGYIKENKDIPVLKVIVVSGAEAVRFKCAGKYKIYYDSKVVRTAEPEEDFKITREGATIFIKGKDDVKATEVWIKHNVALYFVPELRDATFTIFDVTLDKGYFWANNKDRSFRGVLKIVPEDSGFHLVNEVNLEEYLYSVVPSEIGSSANIEALKVQAVIARSYIYKNIEANNGSTDFHLCADVHCQAYTGVQSEQASTTKAVDLTRGEVVMNDLGTVKTFFFSTCGGRTANVADVWGGEANNSLVGVGDYDENEQKDFYKDWPLTPDNLDRWIKLAPVAYCSDDEFFRWFKMADPEETKQFRIKKRDLNGYVRESQNGNKIFLLDRSRDALSGLRSSFYKVEKNLIYGCGWGHGVGLCQEGAIKMAARNKNYKEIVLHYYAGANIKKVYGSLPELTSEKGVVTIESKE